MDDPRAHRRERRPRLRDSPSAPPAMIVSVPSRAAGVEPVTGASTNRSPCSPQRGGRSPARPRGPIVRAIDAQQTVPRAVHDTHRGPSSSSSPDLRPVDDHRDHELDVRRKPPAGVAATSPPCSATQRSAFSGVRFADAQREPRRAVAKPPSVAHHPEPDEADPRLCRHPGSLPRAESGLPRGSRPGQRGRCRVLGLGEVLVRRAVAVVAQRSALACRALRRVSARHCSGFPSASQPGRWQRTQGTRRRTRCSAR